MQLLPGRRLDSRITSALALYTFFVLGVFLVVAPWTPVWDEATVWILPSPLAVWIRAGWVRGVASAVGAIDLVVAGQIAGEMWGRMRAGPGS